MSVEVSSRSSYSKLLAPPCRGSTDSLWSIGAPRAAAQDATHRSADRSIRHRHADMPLCTMKVERRQRTINLRRGPVVADKPAGRCAPYPIRAPLIHR
jgi:hypothetical protein